LILRKIIKIARCHILKLKCTKLDFGWGYAPDLTGGAHSAPPDPLTGFKGPTSKAREVKGRGGEGNGRKRRGGQGKGAGRERGMEGREKKKGNEGIG